MHQAQRIDLSQPAAPITPVTHDVPHRRHSFIRGLLPLAAMGLGACAPGSLPVFSQPEPVTNIESSGLISPDGLNISLATQAQLLTHARERSIDTSVHEIENTQSGLFAYAFRVKGKDEWLVVRGVQAGDGRQEILTALSDAGCELRGRYLADQQQEHSYFMSYLLYALTASLGLSYLSGLRRSKLNAGEETLSGSGGKPPDRFSDVGANRELVAEMRELVREISEFKQGKRQKLVRGVLISGDPGLGQTLMARVLAGEADCVFLSRNSASLQSSSFVGSWVREIQRLFADARKSRDKSLPWSTKLRRLIPGYKPKSGE